MEMPVDVKKVIDEIASVEAARTTPLSVSVYFDDSAPGDVQAFVRQAFASASHHARVSLMYLDGRPFAPFDGDDMAVIVAGVGDMVGSCAAQLREVGVPTMVVTTLPTLVSQLAEVSGHAIPEADLLSPAEPPEVSKAAVVAQGVRSVSAAAGNARFEGSLQNAAGVVSRFAGSAADYIDAFVEEPAKVHEGYAADRGDSGYSEEPLELTDRTCASLSERMGRWVVEACRQKKLAFALAFPFVRKPLANDAIVSTSVQNAGVGALLFIPGADMPVMTLNQCKMLLQIAAAYGEELSIERLKELAAVVAGGFACRSFARQIVTVVPVGGWAVKAAIGGSGTYAMGRAAVEYYEGGANLSKFTGFVGNVRDKVMRVAAGKAAANARARGAQTIGFFKDKFAGAASAAKDRVVPVKSEDKAEYLSYDID